MVQSDSKTGKETYCLHTGLTWMWTLCKTVLNLHQLFICSACDGFYPKCNWRKTDIIASNESISFVTLACNMNKDLANSIIAINPTSLKELHITTDKYASVKKTLLELPVIGTFLYNIKVSNTYITKDFREEYYARPQLVSSKLIDAYYEAAHMNFSHGKYLMASMEANYTKNSIEHALKKLETPIYVIESRNMKDAIAIADSYKKTNSRNEIVYLSNCKKYPQLEIADKVVEAIDMFLK